mmetsp:Transcript_8097/g.11472  ORF Transcript_8097/g.11472 Transcript_8097/m.11472 type:complete len:84 (+) Transcript_8097:110-361(+)
MAAAFIRLCVFEPKLLVNSPEIRQIQASFLVAWGPNWQTGRHTKFPAVHPPQRMPERDKLPTLVPQFLGSPSRSRKEAAVESR